MSRTATSSKGVGARPASAGAAKGKGGPGRQARVLRVQRSPERRPADPWPAASGEDRSVRLAAHWHDIRGEVSLAYGAACSRLKERRAAGEPAETPSIGPRLHELLGRLERAERRLVEEAPRTLGGIAEYLEIAEEILTERRTDPDGPMGAGPALEILSNALKALRRIEDGEAEQGVDRAA